MTPILGVAVSILLAAAPFKIAAINSTVAAHADQIQPQYVLNPTFTWWLLGIAVLWLVLAVCAAIKANFKRLYDPAMIFHFEKEFEDMAESRGRAAAVLLLYSKTGDWKLVPNADELEPVLDFFDNLGFYLYGNQISERVLHQSFCHWILLYYQDGCSYIKHRQEGPEGEKSTWEHVGNLMEEIAEIEAAKQGCEREALKLGPKKYREYLLQEFEESDGDFQTQFKKDNPEFFTPLRVVT